MRLAPLLALLLLAVPAFAQAPRVSAVSPALNAVGVDRTADIVVQFDKALDPETVTPATFRVFGRWSGPAAGALTLESGDQAVRFTPEEPFFAGEAVMVALSTGITEAGGTPLAAPYWTTYWADADASSGVFVEVGQLNVRQPGEGGIISYGAYAGDLDDDGDSDLSVVNELPVDVRVFLNDGTGGYDDFTIHTLPNGSLPSTNEGADFNGDALIDIAVGNGGTNQMSVLLGDGAGGFSSITSYTTNGSGVRGITAFDADGDGHDDIITANRFASNLSFFKGNGDGTFAAPVSFDAGGNGETALAAADANEDGITDLFVGALNSRQVFVMLGDGAGGFTVSDVVTTNGGPWMLAAGDINGDGHVDVAAAGSSGNSADIVYGDGAGGLTLAPFQPAGSFPLAIDLGDLDGDGDLDMAASNYSSDNYYLYLNDGSGGFGSPQILPVDGAGSCTVFHDRDGDGRVDITGIDEVVDRLYFYTPVPSTDTEGETPARAATLDVLGNPFSDEATLRLRLAERAEVRLAVYDVLGREVAVLLDEVLSEGERVIRWGATDLPAGLYVVRLDAGGTTATARLTHQR